MGDKNMESKVLGKGLSALIPDRTLDAPKSDGKTEGVLFLKTSQVKYNSNQPRTNYDDAKLEELKLSIREKGVLQPILVRKQGLQYEVIAGERRLRAAQALNLSEIPVIVKDVNDQEALVIALIENIQREELNPIEEAQAFRKLIEEFHYTQDQVAQAVGKDRSTISNLLRVLKLSQEIQKSIYNGQISMGHARALLSIESLVDQKKLFDQTIKKSFSVRELENMVKSINQTGARQGKAKGAVNYELLALEEDLQRALGTKVRLVAQKKRGKIIIEYYSLSDLDRIITQIKK
jgi:ParB family transcriptional regulator, chromosome partitioning protein